MSGIFSSNVFDRNLRAGKGHSVLSRIRINASQRIKGKVEKYK